MIYIWKWDKIPKLREIDNKIAGLSERGFSSVAIDIGTLPLNSVLAEGLKGGCRGGYKYEVEMYICISDYSLVASVPNLRLGCGLDSANPKSAEYVWEIILKPLVRKLNIFLGKELKGIILRNPAENTADSFYAYLENQSKSNGLSAVRLENCTAVKKSCGNESFFRDKLCALGDALASGGQLPIICEDEAMPSAPSNAGDSLFNNMADALAELFAKGLKEENSESGLRRFKGEDILVFLANAPLSEEITLPEGCTAVAEDIADKNRYSFEGGKVYFQRGGALVLHLEKNPSFNKAAPLFLKCGVSFMDSEGEPIPAMAVEAGDNRLPVKDSFSAQCIEGEIYLDYFDENMVFNGSKLKGEKTESGFTADVTGLIRMGNNILNGEGTLRGDFSTDGKSLVPSKEVTLGDVSQMGMPFYSGELVYEAKLPDIVTAENYLILEGSFAAAQVEIGRRKENLILSPFAVNLFANDGGRIAKIRIFTTDKTNDSDKFGLYNVEML